MEQKCLLMWVRTLACDTMLTPSNVLGGTFGHFETSPLVLCNYKISKTLANFTKCKHHLKPICQRTPNNSKIFDQPWAHQRSENVIQKSWYELSRNRCPGLESPPRRRADHIASHSRKSSHHSFVYKASRVSEQKVPSKHFFRVE